MFQAFTINILLIITNLQKTIKILKLDTTF